MLLLKIYKKKSCVTNTSSCSWRRFWSSTCNRSASVIPILLHMENIFALSQLCKKSNTYFIKGEWATELLYPRVKVHTVDKSLCVASFLRFTSMRNNNINT
ncbi:hypothetical protein PanWU01x14_188160 [Parasponia andersonii]|uniref:Uncharacterized protein n=1 Tax=Parasponia andersonii TaxID=3476 RepID=A0A2P5C3A9_PARAD|nr:hypothetical protein PanWU01x14_188160 [Parasponia andersonii]